MLTAKITLFKLVIISHVICNFVHVHDGRCHTASSVMWHLAVTRGVARHRIRCERSFMHLAAI